MTSELQTLIDQFGLPEDPKTDEIPKEFVLATMKSNDLEVLGALYAYLMDSKYSTRIRPGITLHEYVLFITKYFRRCFFEDSDGEWAHGRYAAAWDFSSWFRSLWSDKNTEKAELVTLKNWLGDIYISGDDKVKECLVNGVLEHILENKKIADFFSDWKNDDRLSQAYSLAIHWSKES